MTNSPWIHVVARVYEHNLVDSAPLSHAACHTRLPSSCNVLTTLDTASASYPLTRLSTHRRHLCSQQEVLPNHRLCIVTLTSGASMPTRFNVPLHTCLPAKSTAAPARAKYNKRCRHPIVPRTSPTQHPIPSPTVANLNAPHPGVPRLEDSAPRLSLDAAEREDRCLCSWLGWGWASVTSGGASVTSGGAG